jgi:DNA primase
VAGQIAELKSRLQRLNPVDDADNYRTLFGDLVAMEQYRKALGDKAAGGIT